MCYSLGTLCCYVWGLGWHGMLVLVLVVVVVVWRRGQDGGVEGDWGRGGRHMLLLLCGCLSGERHVLSESEGPFPAVGLQRHTHAHVRTHTCTLVHEHHGNKNRMRSIMCGCTKCGRQIPAQCERKLWFFLLLLLLDMKQKPPRCRNLVELI